MAELRNDSGALRFTVELVSRENPPRSLPGPGAAGGDASILATAGLEYLDRRDGEWWPFVRLPVLHLPLPAVEGLASQLAELLRGATSGFAWRPAVSRSVLRLAAPSPRWALTSVRSSRSRRASRGAPTPSSLSFAFAAPRRISSASPMR